MVEAQIIHYLQPFSKEKQIATAYNAAIKLLPANDWVCITDQDAMFLLPDTKAQIQDVVNSNPAIELFGCMTNRLNVAEQVVPGMFIETDISRHIATAKRLHSENYGKHKRTRGIIAGLFMLFRVSTWQRVGGFYEPPAPFGYKFDSFFSQKIEKKAILTGVYMFHLYRWGTNDPKSEVKHLIPDANN